MHAAVAPAKAPPYLRRQPDALMGHGASTLDRVTGGIVWLSYCALISAGLIVMGW